jgi:diadenosine tetraphosphatase ApaH/serine/threonine PP2A family protein phosphatase
MYNVLKGGQPTDAQEIERDLLGPARELLTSRPSLIRLSGRTLVVGDLHGDLKAATSAVKIFVSKGYTNLLFLGDYVDRGPDSWPVIELLFGQMLKDPDHVHLLRGNHETLWVNDQHGFKDELQRRKLRDMHMPINEVFSLLPVAAVIDNLVFAVHGGVPEVQSTLDDIKAINKGIIEPDDKKDMLLLGLMWNDPKEGITGFGPNDYRGYMRTFGSDAFNAFLKNTGLERMVRGHQRWKEGFRYFFDEKLLSVFSCASYSPQVRTKAALVEGTIFTIVDL